MLLKFSWAASIATSSTHFLPLRFSVWYFLLPIQEKKKKTFFLPISPYFTFSPTFLLFFCLSLYLPTSLYFTFTLPSSFSLFYILNLLLPILFCINLISFLLFNLYFFHTKTVSTFSLSLSRLKNLGRI